MNGVPENSLPVRVQTGYTREETPELPRSCKDEISRFQDFRGSLGENGDSVRASRSRLIQTNNYSKNNSALLVAQSRSRINIEVTDLAQAQNLKPRISKAMV